MAANKVYKYVLFDTIRSKVFIIYTLVFMAVGTGMFYLAQDPDKALVSLLNIVLLLVPLISIILATIHFYNSREFMEMLLTQPVSRKQIFIGEYFGISSGLSLSFLVGIGLPVMLFGFSGTAVFLLITGVLLTFTFVSLAFLSGVFNNDKTKGIGVSIALWFYFAVLFDGFIMLILFLFSEYPVEKLMLAFSFFNPIDLGRVIVLMKLDIGALMGVTGASFQKIFGTTSGLLAAFLILGIWGVVPSLIALRKFRKKDF